VEALDTVMNDDDAQEYGEFKSPHHNGGECKSESMVCFEDMRHG